MQAVRSSKAGKNVFILIKYETATRKIWDKFKTPQRNRKVHLLATFLKVKNDETKKWSAYFYKFWN